MSQAIVHRMCSVPHYSLRPTSIPTHSPVLALGDVHRVRPIRRCDPPVDNVRGGLVLLKQSHVEVAAVPHQRAVVQPEAPLPARDELVGLGLLPHLVQLRLLVVLRLVRPLQRDEGAVVARHVRLLIWRQQRLKHPIAVYDYSDEGQPPLNDELEVRFHHLRMRAEA